MRVRITVGRWTDYTDSSPFVVEARLVELDGRGPTDVRAESTACARLDLARYDVDVLCTPEQLAEAVTREEARRQ